MKTKDSVQNYFDNNPDQVSDNKTISIGWGLETSDEYIINENFTEDFGVEPDDSDWNEINDSISNFESTYQSILNNFGKNPSTEGHGTNGELVGSLDVTVDDLVNIIEKGEENYDVEITFTSGSGRFNVEELDLLHNSVDASVTFYIPEGIL